MLTRFAVPAKPTVGLFLAGAKLAKVLLTVRSLPKLDLLHRRGEIAQPQLRNSTMVQHQCWVLIGILMTCPTLHLEACFGADPQSASPLDRSNLVAWCNVPFDAKKSGPAERAEMVSQFGLQRVAYDWRAEHVPTNGG